VCTDRGDDETGRTREWRIHPDEASLVDASTILARINVMRQLIFVSHSVL
jgi:hypothetical protein